MQTAKRSKNKDSDEERVPLFVVTETRVRATAFRESKNSFI